MRLIIIYFAKKHWWESYKEQAHRWCTLLSWLLFVLDDTHEVICFLIYIWMVLTAHCGNVVGNHFYNVFLLFLKKAGWWTERGSLVIRLINLSFISGPSYIQWTEASFIIIVAKVWVNIYNLVKMSCTHTYASNIRGSWVSVNDVLITI